MKVVSVIQGVVTVENSDFECPLDPDAEALANKMASYLKSKKGELLEPVTLKGKKSRYYWSIMTKAFCLVHPQSEMYLIPWKKTEKDQYYVYSPHLFWTGLVFLVPKEEIIFMGYN
jgi:hypothetical protein